MEYKFCSIRINVTKYDVTSNPLRGYVTGNFNQVSIKKTLFSTELTAESECCRRNQQILKELKKLTNLPNRTSREKNLRFCMKKPSFYRLKLHLAGLTCFSLCK